MPALEQAPPSETRRTLADELSERGYVRFDLREQLAHGDLDVHVPILEQAYDDLPEDPYGRHLHRYRRYSRGVLIPWRREFRWMPHTRAEDGSPVSEYYQGDHNPEFRRARRRFTPIDDVLREDPLLLDIILFDYDLTTWEDQDASLPLHVGVHLVKMEVTDRSQRAVSSPDVLHQDGEPYTFAHLVRRRNLLGGENIIAHPRAAGLRPEEITDVVVLERFELTRPLESYAVRDAAVSHFVDGIRQGPADGPGTRSVLLIDFMALRPGR